MSSVKSSYPWIQTHWIMASYHWDLFLWSGEKPIKCLIKGEITIAEASAIGEII